MASQNTTLKHALVAEAIAPDRHEDGDEEEEYAIGNWVLCEHIVEHAIWSDVSQSDGEVAFGIAKSIN